MLAVCLADCQSSATQVNQHGRRGVHLASLPCRQLEVTVRHDTPVDPLGTTPEPKASDTVDAREHYGGPQ